MVNKNIPNPVLLREKQEFQKYGRRLHQETAAHSHFYSKHSIEPEYGEFDAPIPPNSNVSV